MTTTAWNPPRTQPWVIRETVCFNSLTHSFERRDLEIAGRWITGIVPPGTSRQRIGFNGSMLVCTPGVIDVDCGGRDAGGARSVSLARCITTTGIPSRSPRATHRWSDTGETAQSDVLGIAICKPALPTAVSRPVFPVVACQDLLSASSLLEFVSLSHVAGTRFGIRIASTPEGAGAFRERFCRSEINLLAYLQLLRESVTLFALSRLARSDRAALAAAMCSVAVAMTPNASFNAIWREYGPQLQHGKLALSGLSGTSSGADEVRLSPKLLLPSGLDDSPAPVLNRIVDAITVSAAAALKVYDTGTLRPGMKADICLFRDETGSAITTGSRGFLTMIASRDPDSVLIEGSFARHADRRAASNSDVYSLPQAG
ncbi:hypothetical protein [Burkholderia sp. BCC0405]|uniref:hypothetical protein n=1 Tax=Burkholderia sp. BCC0405 TaxID=2676298 RepID=UPI00158BF942|nr:hypothetical protein [Burkholderia sp. BCC0405]